MPGNESVQRAILTCWMVFGWIALIVLSGLTTLMVLGRVGYNIPPGRWHDLVATLIVMVVWPVVTLAFRFCVKHRLWLLLGYPP